MKKSARANRMLRRHRRMGAATLSLTSLMDIFTILVFFLLVNSNNSQQLPSNKDIVLPESSAQKVPADTLIVQVSDKDIIVQGKKVASVPDILANKDSETIPALVQELKYRETLTLPTVNEKGEKERQITIFGDRNIPYVLLKKIMLSCNQTDYNKISFAVLKKNEKKDTQQQTTGGAG